MNEFGKWLGKPNGKTMIASIGSSDCSQEQFRAVVTTYCILFGIEVDTMEWDDLIHELDKNYNVWISGYEEFDNYMAELLV